MKFANVFPGEPCTPEPAARYNAVNALLRGEEPVGSIDMQESHRTSTVEICNKTGCELPAFIPVPLTWTGRTGSFGVYCEIYNHLTDFAMWGITAGSIPEQGCGVAVAAGLTWAKLAACKDGQSSLAYNFYPGEALAPTPDGMIPADPQTAMAVLVIPPKYDISSGKWLPALINISGIPRAKTYEFNISCKSLDGENGPVFRLEHSFADFDYCGLTRFPGAEEVPVTEISGTGSLCFIAKWGEPDSNGRVTYTGTVEFTSYSGVATTRSDAFVFQIATCFSSGKAVRNPALESELAMPGWII
ncbi:MAG: hypothetical protein IKA71_02585 [Lentisphaeria bacterium]|nr:hypothetical protein [Lentisphaeria bacterium]